MSYRLGRDELRILEAIIRYTRAGAEYIKPENISTSREENSFRFTGLEQFYNEIDELKIVEILENLRYMGYLEGTFESKILLCSSCGSSRLRPSSACPNCGSEDIEKKISYIHSCGAVILEDYIKTGGACPKCDEDITMENLREKEITYVCNSCGEIFKDPIPYSVCLSCGSRSVLKENREVILRNYKPTEQAFNLFSTLMPMERIVKMFVSKGWEVELNVELEGVSGQKHIIDIYALKQSTGEAMACIVKPYVDSIEIMRIVVVFLDLREVIKPSGFIKAVKWVVITVDKPEGSVVETATRLGFDIIWIEDINKVL